MVHKGKAPEPKFSPSLKWILGVSVSASDAQTDACFDGKVC